MSDTVTGSDWIRQLVFYRYDAEGDARFQSTTRDFDSIKQQLLESNENREILKIHAIRCFATDVKKSSLLKMIVPWIYSIFRRTLKHHFLEIELVSGSFVTMEKTGVAIVLQKSPAVPHTALGKI